MKPVTIENIVAGTDLYVLVTDPMAGLAHRFTVHRISLVGSKGTEVLGRELTRAVALDVVKRSANVG